MYEEEKQGRISEVRKRSSEGYQRKEFGGGRIRCR